MWQSTKELTRDIKTKQESIEQILDTFKIENMERLNDLFQSVNQQDDFIHELIKASIDDLENEINGTIENSMREFIKHITTNTNEIVNVNQKLGELGIIVKKISFLETKICEQKKEQELFQNKCMEQMCSILEIVNNFNENTRENIVDVISKLQKNIDNQLIDTSKKFVDTMSLQNEVILDMRQRLSGIEKTIDLIEEYTNSNQTKKHEEMQDSIDTLSKHIVSLNRDIVKYSTTTVKKTKNIEDAIQELRLNISLLDEGTRLIIANMLLNEM